MPYIGYNDHYGTGFPWGAAIGWTAGLLLIWGVLTALDDMPPSQSQLLQDGKITEEQYCQEYADMYSMPNRCFKYFGVTTITQ